MEVIVGQKRSRAEAAGDDIEDVSISKKMCEESGDIAFALAGQDVVSLPGPVADLSSTLELPGKDAYDGKTVVETLRHLEEELGVSDDCGDFSVPSSEVDDEFPNSAIGSWGEEIWNVHGFDNRDDDNLLTTDFGCTSDSDSTSVSGCLPLEKSAALAAVGIGETPTRISGSSALERFGAVDIGFLLEASDDELGIPPSPTSKTEQLPAEHHTCQQASIDTSEALHEAVTWALEGDDGSIAFQDHGMDDWMGNLDFIIDAPINYSMSSLGEAGLVMCNPY